MNPTLKFLFKASINFLVALNPVKAPKSRRNNCHVKMTFPICPIPTMANMEMGFVLDF
jgi:hypothetical protein